MGKLAINNGKAIRNKPFPERKFSESQKESMKKNLCDLVDSNNFSSFRGSSGQHFWGGSWVRKVEDHFSQILSSSSVFAEEFKDYYVLAVNSCTSALQIACGAIGLKAYDEVIVTPWSMCCSATAPMIYGAQPIFADIEEDYFCLDPKSIREKITKNTKAIIAVDLFGQPFNYPEIKAIADEFNLKIIEDAAQAIGSGYDGTSAGLFGDIGCFSFTQGKHFTCGEGGFIVTKDFELYEKCALIRNHAEAVISSSPKSYSYNNLVGFNMRMTELQAAILYEQIIYDGIGAEVEERQVRVEKIKEKIPFINWGKVRTFAEHSYYVLPFTFDTDLGVSRKTFIEAVKAELTYSETNMGITVKKEPLIWEGYIKPLYKMPLFSENDHRYIYDFSLPVVEKLQDETFCFTTFQSLPLLDSDINDIRDAFEKVYENIEELK